MSARRAATIMAMLAALVVAPSSVFAAAPELRSAAVAPPAGTTVTLFVLSVDYRSSGNPAKGITAMVGDKTITLSLSSGGLTNGTWTGSTTLPAGSWTVTFRAVASKSVQPIFATFGPVSVAQVVSQASPAPVSSRPPSDAAASDDATPTRTTEPKPQASVDATASGAAAGAGGTGQPSSGAVPSGAASTASDPSSPRSPGRGGARARSPRAQPSSSPDGAAAPGQPGADGSDGQGAGQELVSLVLMFGIAGVAAVALLGAVWILIASRRDRGQPSVALATTIDPALSAIPSVEQRALRRARLRPSDDPILAALGLNDEEPSTPGGGHPEAAARKRQLRRAARSQRLKS
jgi:hypothetical protein